MARRKGWDFAQLRTSFPSDPEFQKLVRTAGSDTEYLAAVGLWALALAQAWKEDDGDVADVLAAYHAPGIPDLLERAELVVGGMVRGYGKHTAEVRAARAADAARKAEAARRADDDQSDGFRRTPAESVGVRSVPPESSGLTRTPLGVGEGGTEQTGALGRGSEGPGARGRRTMETGFTKVGDVIGGER